MLMVRGARRRVVATRDGPPYDFRPRPARSRCRLRFRSRGPCFLGHPITLVPSHQSGSSDGTMLLAATDRPCTARECWRFAVNVTSAENPPHGAFQGDEMLTRTVPHFRRFSNVVPAAMAVPCLLPSTSSAQLNGTNLKGDAGLKAGSQAPPGAYVAVPLVVVHG